MSDTIKTGTILGGHALARSQILQPAARTEKCLSECVFAH